MPPAETTPAAADTPALMNPSGMCIRASRRPSRRSSSLQLQLVAIPTTLVYRRRRVSVKRAISAPGRSEARGLPVVAEHTDEGADDLAFRAPGSRALDHRIDQVLVGAGRTDEGGERGLRGGSVAVRPGAPARA